MRSIYTKEYSAFVEVLIAARRSRGLTQAALAERLNKPQSFVSKCESGERRMDIVEFFAVCKILEKDPAVLLKEMGFLG